MSLKQPSTLLLLVHLCILNYPYVNNAEYDHDLFNSRVRGLRDRTKAMEDVTYFLVGQIEGGSSKMLPTYPCRQPSESLAFRTSLTKYLEQLRNHSIRPPRAGSSSTGLDSSNLTAPWWKDVVVRKSLLEESAGEKFDRLILSLSTHALMKASRIIITQETMSARLHSEPVSYANALVKYQSVRQSWTRSASSLLRRQRDLRSLRVKFQIQPTQLSLKYEGLSTARLVALAHSKYQDLMDSCAEETRPSLVTFVELSGVCNLSAAVQLPALTDTADVQCPLILSQPLPLPIAAAHHPSYLRKFKHPLVQGSEKDTGVIPPLKSHARTVLATRIETEKRILQVLANAVSRMGNRLLEVRKAVALNSPPPPLNTLSTFLELLPSTFDIAYNPKPVKELIDSMDLGEDFNVLELDTEIDQELEQRVSNIRTSILPSFPALSNELSLPRLRNASVEPRFSQLKSGTGVRGSRIPRLENQSPNSKRPTRSTRKSVRFSTAKRLTGRPSIFGAFEDSDNSLDCLINQTHDFPTDDEDTDHEGVVFSSPYKTPNARRKTPKVNRIWLPGTPASRTKCYGGRPPNPRESDALALERLFENKPPAMELPSLGSSVFPSSDVPAVRDIGNHQTDASTIVDGEEDGSSVDEDDGFINDPPSLTLKELLLTADTGQFELLADADSEDDRLSSSFLTKELSFSWE